MLLDINVRQQLQPNVCFVWSWSCMWLAETALLCFGIVRIPSSSLFSCNIGLLARQLSRKNRVVQVCRCPLPHPSGVVATPHASACSRSRRASISKRRGSVPCISPCCERLQTTAATLKARGVRCIPPLRAPSSGRSSRSGVPTFNQDGTLIQHRAVRLPSRARARPRIGHCRSRRPQVPTPIPAPCPPVIFGAFLRRKEGGLFFLGSPSRPMSRPVEIHDRRLGGQARDPPTPWAVLSWLACAAETSAG